MKTDESGLEEKIQKLKEQVEDFISDFSQRIGKLERRVADGKDGR